MKTYEVVKNGEERLLVICDSELFVTKVIDRGGEIETELEDQLVKVIKTNDLCSYYWFDEKTGAIVQICQNVNELYYFQNDGEVPRFLYRKEVNYFFMNIEKDEEIALGSYFEKGMFLSHMDTGEVKVYCFPNDQLVEKTYVAFYRESDYSQNDKCSLCCLRNDGLYDVWTGSELELFENNLNIEIITEEYFRTGEESVGKMFFFDEEKQAYVLLFEGENKIAFTNALLEQEILEGAEKVISRLYLFDGAEKVLLAESSEEVVFDDYSVTINGQTWKASKKDCYLLNREPEIVEPEKQENESEMLDNDSMMGCFVSKGEDLSDFEDTLGSSEIVPEEPRSIVRVGGENLKPKKSFWSRFFRK